MNHFPEPFDDEPPPRIVEAEIVEETRREESFFEGRPTPTSFLRRFLSKAALSLFLGLISIGMMGAGLVLSLTVIGLPFGLPLLGIGFFACILAVIVFFSRVQGTVVIGRPPRR